MSTLHLSASREIYTKSGKKHTQTKFINLLQTPTEITYKILESGTFEEQLDAYCKWSEQQEAEWTTDEPYPDDWMEIYDSEIRSKESYLTFDIDIEQHTASGYSAEVYDNLTILRVVLKGEPEFDEILSQKDKDMAFIHHNEAQNHIGVGYRLVVDATNSASVRKRISAMRKDDYELEFFAM
jgi:hypothetical protein